MGEIADDMLDGFMCSWCGVYFVEEHGYPVACDSCWQDAKKEVTASSDVTREHGRIIAIDGVQKHIHPEM